MAFFTSSTVIRPLSPLELSCPTSAALPCHVSYSPRNSRSLLSRLKASIEPLTHVLTSHASIAFRPATSVILSGSFVILSGPPVILSASEESPPPRSAISPSSTNRKNFKTVSCMISSAKALSPTIRKLTLNNFREYVL